MVKIKMRASDSGQEKDFDFDHANRILRNQEISKAPKVWAIVGEYKFQDGQIIKVPKVDTTGEEDSRVTSKAKKRGTPSKGS